MLNFCGVLSKTGKFLKMRRRIRVGARLPAGKTGAACVLLVGPCRALDGHDLAVPFFIALKFGKKL